MQVVATIFISVIIVSVFAVLMAMTYCNRLYKCSECGYTFACKWYQMVFKIGKHDTGILLTCPKCDRYIIANGV